jgi:hypothetical protein
MCHLWITIALMIGRSATVQAVDLQQTHAHHLCHDLYNQTVARWEEKVCTRMNYTEHLSRVPSDFAAFDAFEPECDCSVQDRVGDPYAGDGTSTEF